MKLADVFSKQKRLRWSRSVRDSAYAKFVAARASLRALYDQIDFEKAELLQAHEDFGKANAESRSIVPSSGKSVSRTNSPMTIPYVETQTHQMAAITRIALQILKAPTKTNHRHKGMIF